MTVIREAVIKIRTERAGGAGSGSSGFEARAFAVEARAAREAGQEIRELGRIHEVATRKIVGGFREGGEGALRFGRGLAFLAASGEEDMQQLVRAIATAQGAFDVLAGGVKVVTNLTTALGAMGSVAGVATLAVGAYGLAWMKARQEEEKARLETEKITEALKKQALEAAERREGRRAGTRSAEFENRARRTDLARSESEQGVRIAAEQAALQDRLSRFQNATFVPATGTQRDNVLNTEREKIDIAERLIELSDKQLQLELQKLRAQEDVARQNATEFRVPGTNFKVNTYSEKAFDMREDEFRRKAEQAMTTVVEVIEKAAERIRNIENGVAY